MSAPADSAAFWQLPTPELRLQVLDPSLVVLEGDFWLQSSLSSRSQRHFYLTRTQLAYSNVTTNQSQQDNRIRRFAHISNAKIVAFEEMKTLYGLKITLREGQSAELFTEKEDSLELWLAALAEICVFTDIESDYRLQQKLGAGAYSKVYAAVDLNSGRNVAVKRLKKPQKDSFPARILSEIRILRALRHPCIVQLLRVYEERTDTCLVLSLLPGVSLQRYLSGHGPLDEESVKDILRSLLETLVYLEDCGVVHRDIKPDNIMVETSGGQLNCALVDFGLAISTGDAHDGSICGTPGYIAPEMFTKREISPAADIFSAGMVAYTALRGRNPFVHLDKKTSLSLNQHARVSFTAPRWSKVSPLLLNLLSEMTAFNPAQRPSASACLQHPCFFESSSNTDCRKTSLCGFSVASSSGDSTNGGDEKSPISGIIAQVP